MIAPGTENAADAKILVVDDEEINVRLLKRILTGSGYVNIRSTSEAREVMAVFAEFKPDVVLLDLHMPGRNGFELLQDIRRATRPTDFVPVLMLTGDDSPESKRKALSLGAKDFLPKPFDATEVLLRIHNLLETRLLHRSLENQNIALESRVEERTHELRLSQLEVLERLARTAEIRDNDTGRHTVRVGELSQRLAAAAGFSETTQELIRHAAPLHDLGKIAIPDTILRKPGNLTCQELSIMRTHITIGAQILSGGQSDIVKMAERIAISHHEWWNGEGYPAGIAGNNIPIEARIVAVADCFDALSHDRPYRDAWELDRVIQEIQRSRGTHFDPDLVDVLVNSRCYGNFSLTGATSYEMNA